MIVKGGFDLNGCDRCRLDIICPVAQYLRHNIDADDDVYVCMMFYLTFFSGVSVCLALTIYPHFLLYHPEV